MLQKLNDKIQGLLAWIIISIVAVTFTLFGIDYFFINRHVSDTLIEVNGNSISKKDFQLAYRRFQKMHPNAKDLDEKRVKEHILNTILINKISADAAQKQGFFICETQTLMAIRSIPAFLVDGKFSSTKYMQLLSSSYFTPQTFVQSMHQDLLLQQQRFAWVDTAFADRSERDRFMRLTQQTRSYRYLIIPMRDFLNKVTITDPEMQTYYQKHKQDFFKPDEVTIEYIVLSKQALREKTQISAAQIKAYDTNSDLKQTSTDRTRKIREHLLIERVEKKYARQLELLTDLSYQDPDSLQAVADALHTKIITSKPFSKHGGEEWISKNSAIIKAAFSHDVLKFGNNSAPIFLGTDGVCVLRVKEHVPAVLQPLSMVKETIRSRLKQYKATLAAQEVAQRIVHASLTHPISLQPWNLTWKVMQHAKQNMPQPSKILNRLAFEITHIGDLKQIAAANGDQLVVQLKAIEAGVLNASDHTAQTEALHALEKNLGSLEYEVYLQHLMAGSHIVRK